MLYIKKILIVILLSMIALGVSAQEFRCSVSINSQQIQTTEKQIFETMKQTIEDFVNNRKWTTLTFEAHEKMDCNIGLILSERASLTEFKGQLSIQIRRPVYNSNYTTGLFNYIESDFQFSFGRIVKHPISHFICIPSPLKKLSLMDGLFHLIQS